MSTLIEFVSELDASPSLTPALLKRCRDVLVRAGNGWAIADAGYRTLLSQQAGSERFVTHWQGLKTDDPGIALFRESLLAGQFQIEPYSRVLEVGCCEAEWMNVANHADPTLHLVGIDWRATRGVDHGVRVKADVRVAPFASETFDWVVSLSAIEHIGLGHYDSDPLDPDGDIATMQNVYRWLKPGGQVYFDVPYTPDGYTVCGTSHRTYDDAALTLRLLPGFRVLWTGYSPHEPVRLIEKPLHNADPFYYVAIHAQKPS